MPIDPRNAIYQVYPKHRRRRLVGIPSLDIVTGFRPWLDSDRDVRILELGCGDGAFLFELAELGYTSLVGVDSHLAVPRLGETPFFIEADARDFLAQCEESFDLVCAFDLVEHLYLGEAVDLMRLIFESLSPGGAVVLRTPNAGSVLASYGTHSDLSHVASYSEYSLFQLFDTAGFVRHKLVLETERPIPRSQIGRRGLRIIRRILNNQVHRLFYFARGQRAPRCYSFNLEAVSYKPNDLES